MLRMPCEFVLEHSRQLYHRFIEHAGFGNPLAIKNFLAAKLADIFEVSLQAMTNRLDEWPIKVFDKIDQAMKKGLDFLD